MTEAFKNIILRVATPETSGSAFYLRKQNVVITAEHLVRGNDQVIIDGDEIDKQLARVIYTDGVADLAFLEPAMPLDLPEVTIPEKLIPGHDIVATANPFGSGFQKIDGQVTNLKFNFHNIPHYAHDAVLQNDSNGGPLATENGELVGMNNFIFDDGKQIGLTLPISFILESLERYRSLKVRFVTRCPQCRHFVTQPMAKKCHHCEEIINMPNEADHYEAEGIGKTIESILESMGYALQLARIGSNHWEVESGSAVINITYYEKNGLIIGDAYLCKLPPRSNQALYEYLLRQNVEMENLTFSIKGEDIILSLLIYDRYLNEQTGTELLTNLLEMSDHYDNILVDQFHCLWTSSRKLT